MRFLKPIRLTSYSEDIETVGEEIRDLQKQYLRNPNTHPSSYILPVYLYHDENSVLSLLHIFLRLNTNPNHGYLRLVEMYNEDQHSIYTYRVYTAYFPQWINMNSLRRLNILNGLSRENMDVQADAVNRLFLLFVEGLKFYDVSNACQNLLS